MFPNHQYQKDGVLDSNRFMTLTDGVFAIAMTILVFNIKIPNGLRLDQDGLWPVLRQLSPVLIDYAVSFLVLAVLWLENHRHHSWLKGTKQGHLWMGLLYLMFVGLIPFTTSLMAQFNDQLLADVLFHINLLAVGLCAYGQWHYAFRRNLVIRDHWHEIPPKRLRAAHLVMPATACLGLLLSPTAPGDSNLVYLLMPLAMARVNRIH